MQSFTIEEIKKIDQVWKRVILPHLSLPWGGSLTHSQALAIFCGMGPPGDELGLSLDHLAYKDGYNDYMMLVLW